MRESVLARSCGADGADEANLCTPAIRAGVVVHVHCWRIVVLVHVAHMLGKVEVRIGAHLVHEQEQNVEARKQRLCAGAHGHAYRFIHMHKR